MTYSPIALFVYNRPTHTRQTIEALQKNALAMQSDLIIFSDAPKDETQVEAVDNVRQYIHQINGFKSIAIVERETNFGLAKSIIDGVTSIVNERGRIIVLEDDLVTSPHFLDYMNTALNVYQNEEKIMHISGYMFPIDNAGLPETFFLRTASCWGWATWDRAWRHFEKNPKKLLDENTEKIIHRFNMDGSYNFWTQIEQNERGLINTWAVFWYASVFQRKGLCLHPAVSMVNNIGNDGTGIHCDESAIFFTQLASKDITYFESNHAEGAQALERTKNFFLSTKLSFLSRVLTMLKNQFHRFQY